MIIYECDCNFRGENDRVEVEVLEQIEVIILPQSEHNQWLGIAEYWPYSLNGLVIHIELFVAMTPTYQSKIDT